MNAAPPPDSAAPLPHLGTPDPGAGVQPWSHVPEPGEAVSLEFAYLAADHWRCRFRGALLSWRGIAVGVILRIVFMGGFLLLSHDSRTGNLPSSLITMMIGVLLGTLLVELAVVLFGCFTQLSKFQKQPMLVRANDIGVRVSHTDLTGLISWRNVMQIVEWDNDIYIFAKQLGSKRLFIPRTAFADTQAARHFYAALLAFKHNSKPLQPRKGWNV